MLFAGALEMSYNSKHDLELMMNIPIPFKVMTESLSQFKITLILWS